MHVRDAFNVVVVDAKTERGRKMSFGDDNAVISSKAYRTGGNGGSASEVLRMVEDLEALRSGLLVLLACDGECAAFTGTAGITRRFESSLSSLGIRSFNPRKRHQSFAAIGQKGAGKGRALARVALGRNAVTVG